MPTLMAKQDITAGVLCEHLVDSFGVDRAVTEKVAAIDPTEAYILS